MAQAGGKDGRAAEVTLRPGRPGDAAALARIHHAARASAQPRFAEPWTAPQVAAWMEGVLLARHRVLVAELAGEAVGYLGLDEAAGVVLHLYV
ncbi:MAG TPA: hypothetical protein VGA45_15185, partial [Actinomycetota bacterium]